MLPSWFKQYLTFHRTERTAIIGLAVVLLALVGFNLYQNFFWQPEWEQMELKYGDKIARFIEETDSMSRDKKTPRPWIHPKKELFRFDPNTLDSAGWVDLGFSPKQSAAIINYRNAGAVFQKPEDLKKLFVVDEKRYQELEPFVNIKTIPKTEFKSKLDHKPSWKKPDFEPLVVELNVADSAVLVKLKGIGPSFAKRIMSYRDLLGGYTSKKQLFEVYGMDSSRLMPILNQLEIDTTIRTRINVNTADVKELLRHPYIDLNRAKAIVRYREQHGSYKQLSELENIHLVRGESYRKIAPYLKVP